MGQKKPTKKNISPSDKGVKKLSTSTGRNVIQAASFHTEAMLLEAQRIFHVGSWDWDFATNKIQFSEEMFRLVGMFPGEVEMDREAFIKFLHPDEVARVLGEFQHGATPFSSIEHRIVLRSGETRIAHSRVKAYKDEKGNPLRLLGTTQDITERRRTEEALKESEWRNRIVSELTTDYIFVVDVDSSGTLKLRWASENMPQLTGRTLEETKTTELLASIIHPDDTSRFFSLINRILSTAEAGELICRASLNHGIERWLRIFMRPLVREERNVTTIVGAIQDITIRRHTEESLHVAEEDYRAIFEGAPVGIFRSTVDGRFVKVNQTMAEIYGYPTSEEMISDVKSIATQLYMDPKLRHEFERLIAEHGEILNFESMNQRKDGSSFWTSVNAHLVKNETDESVYYEGFVIDNTARKQAEIALHNMNEQLQIQLDAIRELQTVLNDQAIHDQLTGLYNRHYMHEAIAQEQARAEREGYPISIIVLDLDHLKSINSQYGHFTGGDIALQVLGELLKKLSRSEDIVCRYGGDEFLIVLHNTPADAAYKRAEQWKNSLANIDIESNNKKFKISFSAGIAVFPLNGQNIEEVMQAADVALYQAKEMGRNRVVVYNA